MKNIIYYFICFLTLSKHIQLLNSVEHTTKSSKTTKVTKEHTSSTSSSSSTKAKSHSSTHTRVKNITKYHQEYELPHRLIKNNFFTPEEVKVFRDYALLKDKAERYDENYGTKGWFTHGMSPLLNFYYCKPKPVEKKLTADEIKEKKLLPHVVKLFDKMKDKAESYFNTSLAFYQVTFSVRKPIPEPYTQEFVKMGKIKFAQYPHVDNCKFISDKSTTYCVPAKGRMSILNADYYYGYIDYTSLIYINEVEGGDLMFVDLPKPIKKLYHDLPAKQERECHAKTEKGFLHCNHFYREGNGVRVSPGAGKLALFDSGGRNVHSVLELAGHERRLSLTILYTKMSKVDPDNVPPAHMSAFPYSLKRCWDDYKIDANTNLPIVDSDPPQEGEAKEEDSSSDSENTEESSSNEGEKEGSEEGGVENEEATRVRSRQLRSQD